MKTALVHEFLITWGGSDLVVHKFGEIYPDAPIFTAMYEPSIMDRWFGGREIHTSFLQKVPYAKQKHRLVMPFFPLAFESFDLSEFDVVLSSHHMAAKSVITRADACHVCFVHTPMRFGWDFFPEYMKDFGPIMRPIMRLLFHYLRSHDVVAASRVDYFIANSHNTARRIMKHYRRESEVIHSPVEGNRFRVSEKTEDYYFALSRLVPYKRIDLAVEAFNRLGKKLLVAGTGPELERLKSMAKPNIEFLGFVSDEKVVEYYSKCKAFIFPGEEDFGITPLEAQASGRPVIAYGSGGALETVVGGKTGTFFMEQTPDALVDAVNKFDCDAMSPEQIRAHAMEFDVENYKKKIEAFVKVKYEEFKGGGH